MSESSIHKIAKDNGWNVRRGNSVFNDSRVMPDNTLMEKDGYEVFFTKGGGFNLCIKDPETGEIDIVLDSRCIIHQSLPAYEPLIEWVLKNAEHIISEYQNGA